MQSTFSHTNNQAATMSFDQAKKMVTKRDGSSQPIDSEKIKKRIRVLSQDLNQNYLNLDVIVNKVQTGIYSGVSTVELDNLAAETCAYMNIVHPDYSKLAARIAISNLHKQTSDSYLEVATELYNFKDKVGRPAPLLSEEVYGIIRDNAEKIQARIVKERDFGYDFFGFKTLERSYLLRVNGKIVERP
mmetsp:Transcript_38373/g.36732  ORF Transcript_38373/g.36732 Transcript_38373/m.36732 type:complete len:188 (-) Transcript_38373:111-674(-)